MKKIKRIQEEASSSDVAECILPDLIIHETKKPNDYSRSMLASEMEAEEASYIIPTGSIKLNKALGKGGLPNGLIEVFGFEQQFKTTLACQWIGIAQRLGFATFLLDTESSMYKDNKELLEGVKINLSNLIIKREQIVEEVFEWMDKFIRIASKKGYRTFGVLDSLANTLSQKEEEKGYKETSASPEHAKSINKGIRKFSRVVEKLEATIIVINHAHEEINMRGGFAKKYISPGGRFLKFKSRVRLHLASIGTIRSGQTKIGSNICVHVVKNKVAPPLKKAIIPIQFGKGIMQYKELIETGLETKVLQKTNRIIYFNDVELGQQPKAEQTILKDKKIRKQLLKEVKEELWKN